MKKLFIAVFGVGVVASLSLAMAFAQTVVTAIVCIVFRVVFFKSY